MVVVYQIFEIGLILALALFIMVIAYLAVTAISIKNTAMRCAKRLYERPLNSAKGIGAAGKAVVVQEKVRVQHIADSVKVMAGDVKEAATEVSTAAKTIHPEELKAALNNVKTTLHFLTVFKTLTQAISKQKRAQDRA